MSPKRIEEHTLRVLEFDAIRQMLSRFTASNLGKEAALKLYPSQEAGWVRQRLAETTEIKALMDRGIRLPLAGLKDIRPIFKLVGGKQTVMEPVQLAHIADTLVVSSEMKRFLQRLDREDYPHLPAMAENLHNFEPVYEEINRCIGGEIVKTGASPKLREIRQHIERLSAEIQNRFKAIISHPEVRPAVENDKFLTRSGRAVIAIKANYHQRVQGIVLDRSNTGATLYVEPYELAELSNQLEDAVSEERKEIWRILWELTRRVLDRREDIAASLNALALIDLAYARARFSGAFLMSAPVIKPDGYLRFYQARHPLLLDWTAKHYDCSIQAALGHIVPIDVRIGDDFDMLMVTGPNTGGKTITLKTIGLLVLMAQAGLHIPVRSDSQLPVYRHVFADIGDEQSIQQSLSTFSSHMKQIVDILKRANEYSLVLLDELGAGTDPAEGAALATSLLSRLLELKSHVIITTHLGRLKNFAYQTPRVENASVQFDVETLKPTYDLLIGTPGSSNALVVARRLGIPQQVINQAEGILKQHDDPTRELINQVQHSRERAERNRDHTEKILQRVRAMTVLANERLERTGQEREKLTDMADKYINDALRQIRQLMNRYLSQTQNAPKPWRQQAEELAAEIEKIASESTLSKKQNAFLESLRVGDSAYALPLRSTGVVHRIHRKRQTVSLQMDGKHVEVPYRDLWPAEKM